MAATEIIVDREKALAAVESYDAEAQELKSIGELLTSVSASLEGAWEGRAAAHARQTFGEAVKYITSAQDSLLEHGGYVKRGTDAFVDVDETIAQRTRSEGPVCGEISRYIR